MEFVVKDKKEEIEELCFRAPQQPTLYIQCHKQKSVAQI
jgi:hypothetical protein